MRRACALLVGVVAMPAVATAQAMTFAEVLAARRPGAEELAAQALLAEAAAAAAGGAGRLAEGPSASAVAGPRRSEGEGADADLTVGVELPLLTGRGARGELATRVELRGVEIMAGARALAVADLAAAFVDAWLAQASAEVRQEDLAVAEVWLAAAQRRVDAGADPPYEPTLVAGERDRALLELVAARREVELAWGELSARAEVGPAPRPLELDGPPAAPPGAASRAGSVAAGIDAREQLELSLAAAHGAKARSRWSLQGEIATEGEERLAHVGVAYRLPLRGEHAALAAEQAAAGEQARRDAERARAALRARLAAARTVLAAGTGSLAPDDLQGAQVALAARLAEGKERASQILPLRRQLLDARLAGLAARAALARAAAELHYLAGGTGDAP